MCLRNISSIRFYIFKDIILHFKNKTKRRFDIFYFYNNLILTFKKMNNLIIAEYNSIIYVIHSQVSSIGSSIITIDKNNAIKCL